MSPVRTLSIDRSQWRVYEVSALAVPGAPATYCLIFDSDVVVRRCWTYPADWAQLDDRALWALLGESPVIRPPATQDATLDALAQSATTLIATSLSLASTSRLLLDANRMLREQRSDLLESCHSSRDILLRAVAQYVATLKQTGITPEVTIVLVKDAIRDGLGGTAQAEAPDGAALMGAGVAHAIKAYYAA
jgi:hypothetical protein